jgi:hypothetical protein
MKPLGLALYSFAVVASVSGCGHSPVIAVEPTNAEYQVLSSYLMEKFKVDGEQSKLKLIIVSKTLGARNDARGNAERYKLIPTLETTHREVFRSFLEANQRSSTFQSSFVLPVAYHLVEPSEIESMAATGNLWSRFDERYPHSGLLELSRVGFSDNGTQAAFYTSMRCGSLCGNGYFVIMERRLNSEWVIVQETPLWFS